MSLDSFKGVVEWRKIKAIKFFWEFIKFHRNEIALDGYEEFPNIYKNITSIMLWTEKAKIMYYYE